MIDKCFAEFSRARTILFRFWRESAGAVTVDWVALTAFTLILGMAAAFYVSSSVPHVANTVGGHLENTTVLP